MRHFQSPPLFKMIKHHFNRYFLVFALIAALSASCSKGDQVVELPVGFFTVTTFMVDTFRFKVQLNDVLVTDSLLSPIFSLSTGIKLSDSKGTFKLIDFKTNQVLIDTIIKTDIGPNSISIVQFVSGAKPALAPIPNEPPPAPGKCKVRFTYVQPISPTVPFFDSVRCLVRNTAFGSIPFDTIVLRKYESSEYYESGIGTRFSMIIYNPADGSLIHNGSSASLNTNQLTGFNTAIFLGVGPGSVAGTYNFQIRKAY